MSASPSNSRARGSNSGGRVGRRGGRGGSQTHVDAEDHSKSGRGGRGRRAKSNRRGRSHVPQAQDDSATRHPESSASHSARSGGEAVSDASQSPKFDKSKNEDQVDSAEAEVCFICASPVEHNSVGPCNHRTCHICALRLRALYKNKHCAHCRTEAEHVIFTDDPSKKYQDFSPSEFAKTDDVLGIMYESEEIFEDTLLLLRYNCPDKDCDVACLGWPDLHRHVKRAHHKVMCDLCTRNKKVFTHEHELFTAAELKKHEKFGDDHPGASDQSGFRGHPECGFCRTRFYGDDELYQHCREKHERCHICDLRNELRDQQYYLNYDALEEHFKQDHFLCPNKECLEKKFVVFASELDLKAHQLEEHPEDLSKDARRDARRVDMSTFELRAPFARERGGRRGRDPNTDAVAAPSGVSLRRDEIAFQRQLAIQSAQSITTRTFGGQLTARTPTSSVRNVSNTTASTSFAVSDDIPNIGSLNLNSAGSTTVSVGNLSPQEQARRLRHAAVIERASNLLQNDQAKIATFRSKVSAYQHSTVSASELIDSFFSLFDVSASDLGKLIKELAEIYESEYKREELLQSWNDWRAINEDYPALPGPSGIISGTPFPATITGGGKRVLRLKSSTAQSSRSAVSRQGSWGGSTANPNLFPPISAASSSRGPSSSQSSSITPRAGGHAPSWITSRPSPSSSRPNSTARGPGPTNMNNEEAFPALPIAKKPNTALRGINTAAIRSNRPGGNLNAWGADASNGSSNLLDDSGGGTEATVTTGRKGKGRKKQVLYSFG